MFVTGSTCLKDQQVHSQAQLTMFTYQFEISIPGPGDKVLYSSRVYYSKFEVFKAVEETKESNKAPQASKCRYKVYEYADPIHRKLISNESKA